MKNVILSFLGLMSSIVFAATPLLNGLENSGAQMTFVSESINYGVIKNGDDPVRKFSFQNTDATPLNITGTKAGCGCTVPNYPTEAIAPRITSLVTILPKPNKQTI